MKSGIVLAVSDLFGVGWDNVTISPDKSTYYLGEYLTLTYTSWNGVKFDYWDYIRIFPDDIEDFSGKGYIYSSAVGSKGSNKATGKETTKLDWSIDESSTEYFRGVLYMKSGIVLAVSDLFGVGWDNVTISPDKSTYYLGEYLALNYTS